MSQTKLLTRGDFRDQVFERDDHTCVFCDQPAVDAHHIIDRALWPGGGYYIDNGASVCEQHHLECEMTTLSVSDVRAACGITNIIVPPHMYDDIAYDKWGNTLLPSGQRLKGELFFRQGTQMMLTAAGVIDMFTDHVKYPRTYHFPWSENLQNDDRKLTTLKGLEDQRVIVTEKMDGENTSMYRDHIHARALENEMHPSRSWVRRFWGEIRYDIPEGWRVCGENMFAEHSIFYNNLESYFLGFSVWTTENICLSWDETVEWFDLLGVTSVPVIYDGMFDVDLIKSLWDGDNDHCEGYVVRTAREFLLSDFRFRVGKFVRKNHVQTDQFWKSKPVVPNKLA